jgi:hypothetical protein
MVIGVDGYTAMSKYVNSVITDSSEDLNISYAEGVLLWAELHDIAQRNPAKNRQTRMRLNSVKRESEAVRERLTNIYK